MGFEPTTCALRMRCSAAELHRHEWHPHARSDSELFQDLFTVAYFTTARLFLASGRKILYPPIDSHGRRTRNRTVATSETRRSLRPSLTFRKKTKRSPNSMPTLRHRIVGAIRSMRRNSSESAHSSRKPSRASHGSAQCSPKHAIFSNC